MRLPIVAALAVSTLAVVPRAQGPTPNASGTATAPLAFDVASIKQNTSLDTSGGGRMLPGGRYVLTNVSLVALIGSAYGVPSDQIVGGPGWMRSDRYDVDARAAGQPTTGDTNRMMQALLQDRFDLKHHTEKRDLPVYALVVAKIGTTGPRMRPARVDCSNPEARKAAATAAAPGDAPACGFRPGSGRLLGGGMTVQALIGSLRAAAGRPVIDRTGLPGAYDIDLEWAPAPEPEGVSIFTAVQEQLGLRLEPATAALDVLVIESVERPAPN